MTRQQEITAQNLLTRANEVAQALVLRRWADVATAVEFAETDLPNDLAITDPALYRRFGMPLPLSIFAAAAR